MDAATRLLQAIGTGEICGCGKSVCDGAEELQKHLDAHAHELAERIRNSEELRNLTDDHMHDCNAAADLIDPEEK